jgi:hypothetical protein
MSDERPSRSTVEIADALAVDPLRAFDLLRKLELRGISEYSDGRWRATRTAWKRFPRPAAWQEREAA